MDANILVSFIKKKIHSDAKKVLLYPRKNSLTVMEKIRNAYFLPSEQKMVTIYSQRTLLKNLKVSFLLRL